MEFLRAEVRRAVEVKDTQVAGGKKVADTEKQRMGRGRNEELVQCEESCNHCTSIGIACIVLVSGSAACQTCHEVQEKCIFPGDEEKITKKYKVANVEEMDINEAGPSKRSAQRMKEMSEEGSIQLLSEILVELKEANWQLSKLPTLIGDTVFRQLSGLYKPMNWQQLPLSRLNEHGQRQFIDEQTVLEERSEEELREMNNRLKVMFAKGKVKARDDRMEVDGEVE
ncbi:hypothetical protein BDQ12DRAFT_723610 [Crucibulum laeve]|uniref:Uncharacterized protein n=1 Tax=Crucibulum laeve TaxID=68775 RepID=A0A5C3M0H5_9AGAR|nr:hypothetical protein BDQ12DRAFT_723610 [Crucibulum laeve]